MGRKLTKDQIDTLRRRLEEERARLVTALAALAPEAPRPEQETEFEEVAQRATERSRDLELGGRERDLLTEVDRALAKIAAGRYGVSEKTGAPIPYERLAAMPWAREPVEE